MDKLTISGGEISSGRDILTDDCCSGQEWSNENHRAPPGPAKFIVDAVIRIKGHVSRVLGRVEQFKCSSWHSS